MKTSEDPERRKIAEQPSMAMTCEELLIWLEMRKCNVLLTRSGNRRWMCSVTEPVVAVSTHRTRPHAAVWEVVEKVDARLR